MNQGFTLRTGFILVCTLLLAACSGQRVMMPTPNVAVNKNPGIYDNLHEDLKTIADMTWEQLLDESR